MTEYEEEVEIKRINYVVKKLKDVVNGIRARYVAIVGTLGSDGQLRTDNEPMLVYSRVVPISTTTGNIANALNIATELNVNPADLYKYIVAIGGDWDLSSTAGSDDDLEISLSNANNTITYGTLEPYLSSLSLHDLPWGGRKILRPHSAAHVYLNYDFIDFAAGTHNATLYVNIYRLNDDVAKSW